MELLTLNEQLELAGKEHAELLLAREQLKANAKLLNALEMQLAGERLYSKQLNAELSGVYEQQQVLVNVAKASEDLLQFVKPFAAKAAGLTPGEGVSFTHETSDYINLAAAYKKLGK